MKREILILAAASIIALPASAGRNVGGSLIVHTLDQPEYTAGAPYCDTAYDDPGTCAAARTSTPAIPEVEATVVWFLASFHELSSPAVTAIQFGLRHNLPPHTGYILAYSACGPGAIELPDTEWPESGDPGVGNLIAYSHAVIGYLFPFYWFGVIGIEGGFIGTRTYPSTDEAVFVDDGSPPSEDLTTRFGTMMWGSAGFNECPLPAFGACCFPDNHCEILDENTCATLPGGDFQGAGVMCDPSPCVNRQGACCFAYGHCEIFPPDPCVMYEGIYQGPNELCDPNPCPQPPEACCFEEGTCQMLPPAACDDAGGTPMGTGTICETLGCRAPAVGACCLGDGSCLVRILGECDALGGTWHDGIACDPNPCTTPLRSTTWGRIRAGYR